MKNKIFSEMMTHIPLSTHIDPQNILVITDDIESMKKETIKHKLNVDFKTTLPKESNEKYDVIIICANIDENFTQNIDNILEQTAGIVVFVADDIEKDLKTIYDKFWITMPYRFGHTHAIFASKKSHPQANIKLAVSDMLEGMDYYSTEIHNASFVYGASMTKKLTGLAKR